MGISMQKWALNHPYQLLGTSLVIHADCLDWMRHTSDGSIHAIVTDPPYGVKEYGFDQLTKRQTGNGGIWRIPPSFDGNLRSPLPRFTALTSKELLELCTFFREWASLAYRVLKPGGHLFLAGNAFLSQMVFSAVAESGLEFRGEIIRLVRTLRGGDRPKNAEQEFPDVCTLPRGSYEPWGLFRKPIPAGMTVSDCLREYETGGLRRMPDGNPFSDVIESGRTPASERAIADHPSLKPQAFIRQIVYAALPLGKGIVLDPFMGSGSTVAAAQALNYQAIGVERHTDYFNLSLQAIPQLSHLKLEKNRSQLALPLALED